MNLIKQKISTVLFIIQRLLGRHPFPYYLLRQSLSRKPELAAAADTELVIEGFPRSANSFSVVAFEQAQKGPVKIAHHLHVPAQIIRGVAQGIPTVLLIREPVAAISSLLVREPCLSIGVALWDYIRFHEYILNYRDRFLTAQFEEVTGDFGAVIERINRKWNTEFVVFEHTEQNVEKAYARLDSLESGQSSGEPDEARVARPSIWRADKSADIKARLLLPRYRARLERARQLYRLLCKPERQS